MGVNDDDYENVKIAMFTSAFISMIFALFTILTIYNMKIKKANSYMVVIGIIAVLQFFYDFGYLLRVIPEYEACLFTHFLDTVCGLGVTLFTNILCVLMMYLLVYTKSFDVIKNAFPVAFVCLVCPFVLAILTVINLEHDHYDDDIYRYCTFDDTIFARTVSNLYFWGRAVSIVCNLVLFVFCWVKARILTRCDACSTSTTPVSSAGNDLQTMGSMMTESQHKAVLIIVSRMKYYPLAQFICRFVPAWNEFRNFRHSNYTLSMISALMAPSLGIFYFIIFITNQPTAWQVFKSMMISTFNFVLCKGPEKKPSINPMEGGGSTTTLTQALNPMGFMRFTDVHLLSEDNLDQIINDRQSTALDSHYNSSIFDSDLIRMSSTDIL